MRVCKSIALRLQRLFRIGLIVVAVCAPDVLCQPVLVDDLVAALAHGLPEVGAVVLEAVVQSNLKAFFAGRREVVQLPPKPQGHGTH